jgi:hypothetical protein
MNLMEGITKFAEQVKSVSNCNKKAYLTIFTFAFLQIAEIVWNVEKRNLGHPPF